jgi:hypothetical protein
MPNNGMVIMVGSDSHFYHLVSYLNAHGVGDWAISMPELNEADNPVLPWP